VPVDAPTKNELLALAVAVEALSDHPLAQAIVKDGRERLGARAAEAGDLKSLTGRGVTATVGGRRYGSARPRCSEGRHSGLGRGAGCGRALRENGRTTMVRKGTATWAPSV
jgi:Cd2+/Zn2+-exporting ATPase